jgi:hypothetical protein
MANRSYLYGLSNRPTSYEDRPETITGLSEWPYAVPFSYRVLMSGDPRVCSSLISDGFEDEAPERRTRLHAISGEFDELDTMTESSEDALRASVEREIDLCRRVGAAVDALPVEVAEAGALLTKVTGQESGPPFDAFYGLVLDDDFDNTRDGRTNHPLGVSWWTDVFYFDLWNRAEFEANA